MKNILRAVCVCVILSAAIVGWAAEGVDTQKPVVKVGVLLPLSGQMAAYGEPVQNGMIMRLEELAAQDTHYRYEFIFEDTQGTVKGGTMAAHKLVDRDKVDFLISLWGAFTHPVLPIVERKQIPTLVMLTWKSDMADADMVATISTSPEAETQLMIKAFKKLGYKRIGIVHLHDFEADYAFPIIVKAMEDAGLEIVSDEVLNLSVLDVSSAVMKMKAQKPDVIINVTYDALLYRIEKKFHELAREIPLTNFESYDGVLDFDLVQGRWYVTLAQAKGEFADGFVKRYGDGPSYGSGFAYDAVGLVVRAFEKNAVQEGMPEPTTVAKAFHNISGYPGVVGEINSDASGAVDTLPVLMRVENGKAVEIGLDEL